MTIHTASWGLWATWMISFPFVIHYLIKTVSGKNKFGKEGAAILVAAVGLILGLLLLGWAPWLTIWGAWAFAAPYVVIKGIPIIKQAPKEIYFIIGGIVSLMVLFATSTPLHHLDVPEEEPINKPGNIWATEIFTRQIPEILMAFIGWFPILGGGFLYGITQVYGLDPNARR